MVVQVMTKIASVTYHVGLIRLSETICLGEPDAQNVRQVNFLTVDVARVFFEQSFLEGFSKTYAKVITSELAQTYISPQISGAAFANESHSIILTPKSPLAASPTDKGRHIAAPARSEATKSIAWTRTGPNAKTTDDTALLALHNELFVWSAALISL